MNICSAKRSAFRWWAQMDSNHRPRAYQARALATWAMSPCSFWLRFLCPLGTHSVSSSRFSPLFVPWWRWWDSNPWPSACRADALPTELHPHRCVQLCFFQVSPDFLRIVPENRTTSDFLRPLSNLCFVFVFRFLLLNVSEKLLSP